MNILTFDIEEWFHLLDNDSTRYEEQWKKYEIRIHKNVDRILNILEESNTKATFFIVGWIAKNYPEIVKKIGGKYEIGSHTMNHGLIWQQKPQEFRNDVEGSLKLLQDLTGKPIKYFRAPGFSIRETELWAFETLIDLGIEIDSSIFPGRHSHGGFRTYGKGVPKIIDIRGKMIKEFPISGHEIAGSNIVYQGGGYFRLFPYKLIKNLAKKDKEYLLSYIHPRDLDPGQPMIEDLSLMRRFKSYVGLEGAEKKLRNFINDFNFTDIGTANIKYDWSKAPVIKL